RVDRRGPDARKDRLVEVQLDAVVLDHPPREAEERLNEIAAAWRKERNTVGIRHEDGALDPREQEPRSILLERAIEDRLDLVRALGPQLLPLERGVETNAHGRKVSE